MVDKNNIKCKIALFYFVQSVMKYIPFRIFSKIRPFFYRPFFAGIGERVAIHEDVHFKFPEEITLGANTQIAPQCIFAGAGGLKLGENVMVGAGTKIITSSHNHQRLDIPMIQQGLSYEGISIEDDVWFGFCCVVLGGTKINRGTIIAANSVVLSGDYPPYVVLGGVPAKIIKYRTGG